MIEQYLHCQASRRARPASLRKRFLAPFSPAFEARPHRLPHPAVDKGEILKFEANLAKVLLGFVILEGSDDFLQQKTAVDNGLQTIGRYRPNHVLLICSAANGDPADTNLIRKQCRDRHCSRKPVKTPIMAICPPVLQAVIDCVNVPGPPTSIT